jgi:thiamine-phosphate pyrophosphorylase
MINDRVDIAQAAEADGVHLPELGLSVGVARWLLGRYVLTGRSVHSVDAAVEAQRSGADYVQVGSVFESTSHPGQEPAGVELIREVRNAVSIPVIAVGGITAANVGQVIEAGAHGIAVISAILRAEDKTEAAKELKQALTDAWANRPTGAPAGA